MYHGMFVCFLYRARGPSNDDCQMKEGNPFGPFWDELGVNFDHSEITGLKNDLSNERTRSLWNERYISYNHSYVSRFFTSVLLCRDIS